MHSAVINYLIAHGRMSGQDICDDCSVTSVDVELACQDGAIQRCSPELGGSEPWYRVSLGSVCDLYDIGYPY